MFEQTNPSLAGNTPTTLPAELTSHLPGLNLPQRIYATMTAIFVICLVVANLTGAMLFSFNVTLPAFGKIPILLSSGIIPFPVTFILTDRTHSRSLTRSELSTPIRISARRARRR